MAAAPTHVGACGQAKIEYSLDGGATWQTSNRMDGSLIPTKVTVRLAGPTVEGCHYPVSLASYNTQGPTWATSGNQTFLGWVTTNLSATHQQATLDLSAHTPSCFGQIDLYRQSTVYNGVTGPLPHYPNLVIGTSLITAWNGAAPCVTPTPTPKSTPCPPSPTPSAPAVGVPVPPPPTHPKTPATPPPSSPPQSSPSAAPSAPATPPETLAHTGSNSTQTLALAASGAALAALGAGVIVVARRRRGTAGR